MEFKMSTSVDQPGFDVLEKRDEYIGRRMLGMKLPGWR